jgi:hypothetical protein
MIVQIVRTTSAKKIRMKKISPHMDITSAVYLSRGDRPVKRGLDSPAKSGIIILAVRSSDC